MWIKKKLIKKFRSDYLALEIPVTPKIHCIFYHVAKFCNMPISQRKDWDSTASKCRRAFIGISAAFGQIAKYRTLKIHDARNSFSRKCKCTTAVICFSDFVFHFSWIYIIVPSDNSLWIFMWSTLIAVILVTSLWVDNSIEEYIGINLNVKLWTSIGSGCLITEYR